MTFHNIQHQKWLINVHKQVKDTQQLINTFIQENMTEHSQSTTQHKYLTQMVNEIIVEDSVKGLNYKKLGNHPKYKKIWK